MSDLISRQAAIDAVCMDWCGDKHSECRHANDEYDWCDGCETVRLLTNLPTVTETKVIAEVKVDTDEIIERLKKTPLMLVPNEPPWIPVTERLPEEKINGNTYDFEEVLCTTIFGDVRVYKFGKPIGWEEPHFWNGAGNMDKYVTAWMPKPEPWKEQK